MQSEAISSKLQNMLESVDAVEVANALAEAKEANLTDTVDYQTLEQHAAELTSQLALKEAMEKALEAEDLEQLQTCLALVKQNGFDKNPESWMPGLNGAFLAGQVFVTMEKLKEKIKVAGLRQDQQEAIQASFKGIKASQNKIEESQVNVPNETEEEKAEKASQQHAANLASQTAMKEAMEKALKDEDLAQLKVCLALVKKNGLDKNPESWLPGLNGASLASQVFYMMEQLKEKAKVAEMRQEQQATIQATLFKKDFEAFETNAPAEVDKEKLEELEKEAEDKKKCFAELQQAAAEYDVISMKDILGQASDLGMSEDLLGSFHALYAQLKTEDFLQSRISLCEEALLKDDVEEIVIKQLRNLAYQLARLTGDELYWEDAWETIRAAEKKGKDDTIEEDEELPLEFYQLGHFSKLKKHFRGHDAGLLARLSRKSGKGDMEKMVSHSYDGLHNGLTELPAEYEQSAVKNFGAILEWMGDKPVTVHRLSASHDIVALANSHDSLKDEIYCQVMKQLTNNPSAGSILLGWKLLLLCCQLVSPSEDLYKFIRYFIISNLRELRKTGGELLVIVRQCLRNINKQACRAEKDEVDEEEPKTDSAGDNAASVGNEALDTFQSSRETFSLDDAKGATSGAYPTKAPADEGFVDVVVILLDYSTRKIRLHESSTLIGLAEALASHMLFERFQDFSFFHLMVGSNDPADVQRCVGATFKGEVLEVQRLLPMKTAIKPLLKKWEALKRMTGKDSYFLFKRCFIDKGEELRSWDTAHALLTFRQTIWDYLHLPICESRDTIIQAAVALLSTDRENFYNILKDKDISGKGVLEQVVPEHFLRYHTDRSRLSKEILQRLNQEDVEPLGRHSKMSRFVELCQSMKMFGCQYWHVEQCAAPGNQKAIEQLPESALEVNPKEPCGEYWIVVSTSHVSFVPFDGAPGEEVLRSFEFSSTSRDQLVHWGHHQNLLQLVVKTVDPGNVAAGQVEFSMSFRSTGALDCAFALQVAKGAFKENV